MAARSALAGAVPGQWTQAKILVFFLPLMASWLLMTGEVPAISAAIARLPNPETMIAALGILMSLSVTIESPVIMLLGTSTALARDGQAYRVLSRFALHMNIALTVITALVAFTPLYDLLVPGLMGIPATIAETARPGLQIMLLWSGAIGWRRFKQGVLIRYGASQYVGWGTAVRLLTSAGLAWTLAVLTELPGLHVGAIALVLGVIVEAMFAHIAAIQVVREHLGDDTPHTDEGPLSYMDVVRYHTPLALTSLMVLLAQPVIGAALARTPNPEVTLAAWPITFGVLLIVRSFGLALPELVIALLQHRENFAAVRTFARGLALTAGALLLIIALTPVGLFYYRGFLGVSQTLTDLAMPGLLAGLAVPVLMVWGSWERGVLMTRKHTAPLSVAMALHIVTLITALATGVALGLPGVPLAAGSLGLAMLVEAIYLYWQARPVKAEWLRDHQLI